LLFLFQQESISFINDFTYHDGSNIDRILYNREQSFRVEFDYSFTWCFCQVEQEVNFFNVGAARVEERQHGQFS